MPVRRVCCMRTPSAHPCCMGVNPCGMGDATAEELSPMTRRKHKASQPSRPHCNSMSASPSTEAPPALANPTSLVKLCTPTPSRPHPEAGTGSPRLLGGSPGRRCFTMSCGLPSLPSASAQSQPTNAPNDRCAGISALCPRRPRPHRAATRCHIAPTHGCSGVCRVMVCCHVVAMSGTH